MVKRGVVQLGIVPVISASRRSRRLVVVTRCRPRARATIQINIFYISHEFSLIGRLHEPPPLDTAMPRFYDCLPGGTVSRLNLEDARRFSFFFPPLLFLFFRIKTPFNCRQPCFSKQKSGMAGEKTCYPPG